MKIRGMIQHSAVFYISLQPLPSFASKQYYNVVSWCFMYEGTSQSPDIPLLQALS